MSKGLMNFRSSSGIEVKSSPIWAPESNGTAERLFQERWTRTRVLLCDSDPLPHNLWDEALKHANWLSNRLPTSFVIGHILIQLWDPIIKIDFLSLVIFVQTGFDFVYCPHS